MNSTVKIVLVVLLVAFLLPLIFHFCLKIWGSWNDEWSGFNASHYVSDGICNIAVIPIMGEIHAYGAKYDEFGNEVTSINPDKARLALKNAENDEYILGVLALIDSPGGTPVASEIITNEFKNSSLPVASYIADSGTSGGYLIATAGDTVIASPFSDIGSIGVSMSYLDYSEQNENEGIKYVELSSGKYKDYTSIDKPMTEEERALLKRDLGILHDEFVRQVAENRNLSIEEVAKLADGSSMPGKLAQEAKLVDQVGNMHTVREWFAKELNMPLEEVILCN